MWTDITRKRHAREALRLPSDLTDAEWVIFEPLMPIAAVTGRPRKWTWRELLNAMLYLLRGGLPWRMLPPGLFPPVSTVQRWFYTWRDNGLWRSINHALVMLVREAEGREASPSACVIDSQSDAVPRDTLRQAGHAALPVKMVREPQCRTVRPQNRASRSATATCPLPV